MRRRMNRIGHSVRRSRWALVLGGLVIACVPVLGHHSYAATYLEKDTIEVEGDVVEFQYKNPHSWIHILGQETFGSPKHYAAEWASPSRLERDGITKNTLQAGDRVRIWASPNQNPSDDRIRLKHIERRSDGWTWGQRGQESR